MLLPIAALLGCGSDDVLSGGAGGAPSSSNGTGSGTSTCGQEASCPVASPCLATAEYDGKPQFTLRIAELGVTAPASLAGTNNGSLLRDLLALNLPACGSFVLTHGVTSWLLGFDLTHGMLTVGGSAPPADSTKPYAFIDNQTVQQGSTKYLLAPASVPIAASSGFLAATAPMEVNLPMYFPVAFFQDTLAGPNALPLHHAVFSEMAVSASHDCIGHYDPGLFEAPGCQSQLTDGSVFIHAGHLEGYMLLDELDNLIVPPLKATMCVVLTSFTATQLDSTGIARCPESGGTVTVAGDWCSATNAPATASCADALHLVADFAASAVPMQ
jgi:hypothetical protein